MRSMKARLRRARRRLRDTGRRGQRRTRQKARKWTRRLRERLIQEDGYAEAAVQVALAAAELLVENQKVLRLLRDLSRAVIVFLRGAAHYCENPSVPDWAWT